MTAEQIKRTTIFDASYRPHDEGVFRGRFEQLYLRDFQAYEDSGGKTLLQTRLTSTSRVFRQHPELAEIITNALESDLDEDLITASELAQVAFFESIEPTKMRPISVIFSYACLTNNISDIAINTHNPSVNFGKVNHISNQAAKTLVQAIPDQLVDDYRSTCIYLEHRIDDVFTDNPSMRDFIRAKITTLNALLRGRDLGYRYAMAVPSYEEPSDCTISEVNRDTREIGDLFHDILKAQHYGPKLAYTEHRLGGSLVFGETNRDDTDTEGLHVHPLTLDIPTIARVIHSTLSSFNSLKPSFSRQRGVLSRDYTALRPAAVMHIGKDGELFTDMFGAVSLRDIFVRQGKYRQYREIQAEILTAYFDMTQPAEVIQRIGIHTPVVNHDNKETDPGDPMDVFRRLLIPRVRFVTDQTQHQQGDVIDREPEIIGHDNPRRRTRYHEVGWFRRSLPEGWHASPRAKELALQHGIELKDNETFVEAHQRGSRSLGTVAGHLLVEVDEIDDRHKIPRQ